MLIINADDLGRNSETTDNIISCFRRGRITSASAMVFMLDSERAAVATASAGLESGLHLNLDLPFDGPSVPPRLREHHRRVVAYLRGGNWKQLTYNPLLKSAFPYIFQAQYDEYCRLFGREPVKIDGHDHMHLCMNMIADGVIPPGKRVRRNLTFARGQRSLLNRFYRRLVDAWLVRRYVCSDAFFAIDPVCNLPRQEGIFSLALSCNVELMVHPGLKEEYDHLLGPEFESLLQGIPLGTYSRLPKASN